MSGLQNLNLVLLYCLGERSNFISIFIIWKEFFFQWHNLLLFKAYLMFVCSSLPKGCIGIGIFKVIRLGHYQRHGHGV